MSVRLIYGRNQSGSHQQWTWFQLCKYLIVIALCAMAFLFAFYLFMLPTAQPSADIERANFSYCGNRQRVNCVVDGDTFWYQGRKIRISDINTPEISRPQCTQESILAERAKLRLYQLLNAGNFSLISGARDTDYFGRDLRIIKRNGRSLGDIMIAEGLAHQWRGRKESWC